MVMMMVMMMAVTATINPNFITKFKGKGPFELSCQHDQFASSYPQIQFSGPIIIIILPPNINLP